jgi:hypothetical protein
MHKVLLTPTLRAGVRQEGEQGRNRSRYGGRHRPPVVVEVADEALDAHRDLAGGSRERRHLDEDPNRRTGICMRGQDRQRCPTHSARDRLWVGCHRPALSALALPHRPGCAAVIGVPDAHESCPGLLEKGRIAVRADPRRGVAEHRAAIRARVGDRRLIHPGRGWRGPWGVPAEALPNPGH